jgi:hypothetical protein
MQVVVNQSLDQVPTDIELLPTTGGFFENLLLSCGYSNEHLPVADLLRQALNLKEGKWVVVSPIHWEASHNDATISAVGSNLDLSDDEAKQWFDVFADFIQHDGMEVVFVNNYTWLINIHNLPTIHSKPLYQVVNQSILPHLKALDEGMYWQRFITETQMLLNSHPLNAERPGLPINGVWLWGEGQLSPPTSLPVLISDDTLKPYASILSTNVNHYTPTVKHNKNNILLLSTLPESKRHTLAMALKRYKTCWYWNNGAYKHRKRGWISRIWS